MLRQQIITEARSWIGTRFHHQGRCKKTNMHKGGVDCIGLIVGVAQAVGFTVKDETDYSRQPQGSRLKDAMHTYLNPIPLSEVRAGDVLLFTFEKDPQHVGIVSELSGGELGLIHAYREASAVVEHRLDDHWWKKATHAFSFPQLLTLNS